MGHLIIRHRIADLEQWRSAYDDHRDAREEAGLKELYLWHNQREPAEIVILFETSDLAKAKNFVESPDLEEKMEAAGVEGTPEFLFLAQG